MSVQQGHAAVTEFLERESVPFEVGAVPPFGPMFHALELVDERLLDHDRILCGGGDHEHGVLVDPRDMVRAAQARVADICED